LRRPRATSRRGLSFSAPPSEARLLCRCSTLQIKNARLWTPFLWAATRCLQSLKGLERAFDGPFAFESRKPDAYERELPPPARDTSAREEGDAGRRGNRRARVPIALVNRNLAPASPSRARSFAAPVHGYEELTYGKRASAATVASSSPTFSDLKTGRGRRPSSPWIGPTSRVGNDATSLDATALTSSAEAVESARLPAKLV